MKVQVESSYPAAVVCSQHQPSPWVPEHPAQPNRETDSVRADISMYIRGVWVCARLKESRTKFRKGGKENKKRQLGKTPPRCTQGISRVEKWVWYVVTGQDQSEKMILISGQLLSPSSLTRSLKELPTHHNTAFDIQPENHQHDKKANYKTMFTKCSILLRYLIINQSGWMKMLKWSQQKSNEDSSICTNRPFNWPTYSTTINTATLLTWLKLQHRLLMPDNTVKKSIVNTDVSSKKKEHLAENLWLQQVNDKKTCFHQCAKCCYYSNR